MKAKIVIVGGGIMGVSIALDLAQRTDPLKEPIVLLERDRLGAGSTGGSGAILRVLYADRLLASMARESMREFAAFETRTGRSIGFCRSGVLTLAGPGDPRRLALLRDQVSMLREHGFTIELLQGDALREVAPGFSIEDGTVGAWEPESGFVDPVATIDAFAALARTHGAITRLGSGVEEILVENGRAVGVRTGEIEVEAEAVVVAGGPWTSSILGRLDVRLPLRVRCPQNFFFAMPEADPTGAASGEQRFDPLDLMEGGLELAHDPAVRVPPVVIDFENDGYFRCEPPRRHMRVGQLEYERYDLVDHPSDTPPVDDAKRATARELLRKRLPDLADRDEVGSIVSWYTVTPDAQPMVGPVPGFEALYVACGFSGHGFKLAPSIGLGVRQMVLGEPVTAFDPEFFSPARFGGEVEWAGCFGM